MKKSILLFSISIFIYITAINLLIANSKNTNFAFFEQKLSRIENMFNNPNKYPLDQINTNIKETLGILAKSKLSFEEKKILQFKFNISLAYSYDQLNKIDSAFYYFNSINAIISQYPKINQLEPWYVAYHWNNLGMKYKNYFDNYSKAISCYEKGLLICENIKDTSIYRIAKIQLLNNLANAYDATGKSSDAFILYQKITKAGLKGIDYDYDIYTSIGWNYIRLGKYDKAIQYFKKSYQILNVVKSTKKSKEYNALGLFDIGMCHSYSENFLESDKSLELLIRFYQKEHIYKNKYLSLALLQKAQNAYEVNDYEKGISYVQKAIKAIVVEFNEDDSNKNPTLSQSIIDYPTLFHVLTFKAKLLSEKYKNNLPNAKLDLIVNSYSLAIKLSNMYRKKIDAPEDKLRLNQNNKQVFDNAIYFAHQWFQIEPSNSKANTVLSIVESTKALALGDKISTENINVPLHTQHLQNKEQLELSKNAILRQKIADSKLIKEEYDSLKSQLYDSETELSKFNIKKILNDLAPTFNTKAIDDNLIINEIIALTSPESVYLSYNITSDYQVYVLAINHQKIMFKKLAYNPIFLKNQCQDFINSLKKNPTVFDYRGENLSEKLYNYLIKPIEPMLLNKKRLLISRDGALNYLPFEVLESGKSKKDYMLKHFAISYQYTAQSFLIRHEKQTNTSNKLLTIAPFIVSQKTPNGQKLEALKTIPKSRDENFISQDDATKLNFISKVPNYNIINLECHSVAHPKVYDQSFVLFNPNEKDWKLGFHEILTLDLSKCKLLILASCNSAFGVNEAYEGILSLSYAFYKAGSHSVISAQWAAHDRSSAFITTRFYNYINQGDDKDYALQKAKIDFLNSSLGKELDHPFFWANLTLTGNINAIKSSPPLYLYFIIIIPIICIILMYIYKKKRIKKPLF